MRRNLQSLMVLILFLGLSWSASAQEAVGKTAAIPVMAITALGGNQAEIPGWQPALGQGISEMLIESLESSNNKFQVLETAETTDQQSEPQSGGSNPVGGQTKPAKGVAASSDKPGADGSAGSDFTFCGEVTQFMVQTNSSQVGNFVSSSPFANLGMKVFSARVQIEWRIVDTETKRVIKRGIAAGSAHGSGFNMAALATTEGKTSAVESAATAGKTATGGKTAGGGTSETKNSASFNNIFNGLNQALGNASNEGSGGDSAKDNGGKTGQSSRAPAKAGTDGAGNDGETIGYGNPAFVGSALGKATAAAVNNIIEQLAAISLPEPARVAKLEAATSALKHTPGKVLAVAGKDIIIVSLGSKEGFKEGDELNLYETVDVKDDKGNVVFTDEKLAGEITLDSVQEERSRASYAGNAVVQQGWTVKTK